MCLSLDILTSILWTGGTYSGRTHRSGLCYNFSTWNDLTQMVNFPALIPDCDSHSPAFLDLFISSDASICSKIAFPPLGNSDHVTVSVSINFPSNSKQDAPFHHLAYDYSRAAKHVYATKSKESITFQKLGSQLLANC